MATEKGFIREVFYCGITAEENELIKDAMRAYNLSALRSISSIVAALMLLLFIASFVFDDIRDYHMQYLGTFVSCAVVACLSHLVKPEKLKDLILPLIILMVTTILCFGIVLGVKDNPEDASTIFIAMLIVAPLPFNIYPIYTGILELFSCIVFIAIESMVKTPEVFFTDSLNAICFTVGGVVLGWFQLKSRLRGLVSTATMERMSVTDTLTGLKNRRAFEDCLLALSKDPTTWNDITLVSIDLNGLKTVNDTKMHEAGDELLKGAAYCITTAFSDRASVFRVGGDEFAVISLESKDLVAKDLDVLSALVKRWHGEKASVLSMAVGAKSLSDVPSGSLDDLRREADHAMYAEKARFYCESGRDRRQRQELK